MYSSRAFFVFTHACKGFGFAFAGVDVLRIEFQNFVQAAHDLVIVYVFHRAWE